MKRRIHNSRLRLFIVIGALLVSVIPLSADAPSRAATSAFDQYVRALEARLDQQHITPGGFLAPEDRSRLLSGQVIIENLLPSDEADPPRAMLHHWRGTAFAPGATPADFDRVMRNFNAYPQVYAPQVLHSAIEAHNDDHYRVTMRVRQKQVLTVVMDTSYAVTFGSLDSAHGWSASRSTAIHEIDDPGTSHEQALSDADQHGFLWRLNTYWSYAEADGGLYLQIESVSLTRSIPTGLGWAVGPFVESIPRDSLAFTLRKTCVALKPLLDQAKGESR